MKELLIPEPAASGWVTLPACGGMRVYTLWENKKTGASIALLDVPKGATIPTRHRHASNQFMYCIDGVYEYLNPGLTLKKGSFYMNPKGHPHGPTVARRRCLLLEIYDGPHYFELPSFHNKNTVGKIAGSRKKAAKNTAAKSPGARKGPKSRKRTAANSVRKGASKSSRPRNGRKA
jgi:hypothetical protein